MLPLEEDLNASSFLLGTLTGLTTSAVTWLARRFLGGLLGLLQAAVMPSGSVQGSWHATYSKGPEEIDEMAQLKQVLHFVWGTISNKKNDCKYQVRGSLRDRVLVATYEIEGRPDAIDRGTFTLRMRDKGDEMDGSYSWMEAGKDIPQAGTYRWTRL